MSGTRVKDQILEQKNKNVFSTVITEEIRRVGALCQQSGSETNRYILYYLTVKSQNSLQPCYMNHRPTLHNIDLYTSSYIIHTI